MFSKKIIKLCNCFFLASISFSQLAQADLNNNSKCEAFSSHENPYESNLDNVTVAGSVLIGTGILSITTIGSPNHYWAPDDMHIFREQKQAKLYLSIMEKKEALEKKLINYQNEIDKLSKVNGNTKIGEITAKEKISGLSALKVTTNAEISILTNKKQALIKEILQEGQMLPPKDLQSAKSLAQSIESDIKRRQNLVDAEDLRTRPYVYGGLAMIIAGSVMIYKNESLIKSYNDYMDGLVSVPDDELVNSVEQTLDCVLTESPVEE